MDPRGKELGRGTFDGRNIPIKNQMLRNFFEQYTAIATYLREARILFVVIFGVIGRGCRQGRFTITILSRI